MKPDNRVVVSSPVGELLLEANERAVTRVRFGGGKPRETNRVLERVRVELQEYFAGKRREFTVPVEPEGTMFQRAVWEAMRKIPYGRTAGYGELARRIGRPKASRAVGQACGANPVAILIPCHRVIGEIGRAHV